MTPDLTADTDGTAEEVERFIQTKEIQTLQPGEAGKRNSGYNQTNKSNKSRQEHKKIK